MRRFLTSLVLSISILAVAVAANAAKRALIVHEAGAASDAASVIEGILAGRGFAVTRLGSLPGDLAPYCCIWDIRPFTELPPGDRGSYRTFLNQGHGLALIGENVSCCESRNDSLEAFIGATLSGGSVGISSSCEWLNTTTHGAVGGHPITNGIGSVTYNGFGAGLFDDNGNGRTLTQRIAPTGTCALSGTYASALVWDEGFLGAAPAGRLVTVLDVNWLVETIGSPGNFGFAQNISEFLCPVIDAGIDVTITEPSGFFTRECPNTIRVRGVVDGNEEDCAQPTSLTSDAPAANVATSPASLSGGLDSPRFDGPKGWTPPTQPAPVQFTVPAPEAVLITRVEIRIDGGPWRAMATVQTLPAPPPVTFVEDLPLVLGRNTFEVRAFNDLSQTASASVQGDLFDTRPPVFTVGTCDDAMVDLGLGCQLDYAEVPLATDICDPTVTITASPPLPITFSGPGSQVITYTARDDSGNVTTCSRTVTARDIGGPILTCPAPVTLECIEAGGRPASDPDVTTWLNSAAIVDNCDPNPALSRIAPGFFPAGCPPGLGTGVTWEGEDASMNRSSCTSTLSITDTTPPDITATPGPLSVECSILGGIPLGDAQVQAWLAEFMADDLCYPGATLDNDATDPMPLSCAGTPNVVTFTAIDDCGNGTTFAQDLTVTDTTAPGLTVPAPLPLECSATGGVPATDPTVRAWLDLATATDACSLPTVTNDVPALVPVACGGLTTAVNFEARDDCANSTIASSTITVDDTSAPTLSVPAPLTLECSTGGGIPATDAAIAAWLGSATATDVCGAVTLTHDAPSLFPAGCGVGTTTTVTFTAVDPCGNTSALTSTITVRDLTAPVLAVPPPLTLECSAPGGVPRADAAVQAWLALASANDVCGAVTLTNDAPALVPSACGGLTTTVAFTAVDGCGNTTILTSTITVVDTTAPVLTVPATLPLECTATGGVPRTDPAVQAWLASVATSDVCGTVTLVDDVPSLIAADCAPGQDTTVTFTATDDCGNATTLTSTITVADTTAPTVDVPADITLECTAVGGNPQTDAAIVAWLAGASTADVCGAATLADDHPALFAAGCGVGAATSVQFTGTDGCALATTTAATLTVRDTTDPDLTVPGPLTLECNATGGVPVTDPAVIAWRGLAAATDICHGVGITDDTPTLIPAGCGVGTTTTVAFAATDTCGNATTATSTITVADTTAPSLTVPGPLSLECNSPGGVLVTDAAVQAWLATATAGDTCSSVTISHDAPALLASACGPGATTVITFIARDGCDNETALTSTITVRDTTPPTLTVPAPIDLECNSPGGVGSSDPVVQAWLAAATADDVCGGATVTHDAPAQFPSACGGAATTVTFTAVDDCGNTAVASATITVRDTTPPSLVVPPPLTLECDSAGGIPGTDPRIVAWLALASASDVCDGASLSNDAPGFYGSGCTPGQVTTVTFQAVDNCGNLSAASATVTVADTTPPLPGAMLRPAVPLPPQSAAPPASVCSPPVSRRFVVECAATDACDEAPAVAAAILATHHDVPAPGTCSVRTDRIDVDCGEEIEIRLLAPPCPASGPLSAQPSVAINSEGIKVISAESAILEVTATDECGNAASATYDPAAEPSPLCDERLGDDTCCPAIGAPPDPECEVPPCGRCRAQIVPAPVVGVIGERAQACTEQDAEALALELIATNCAGSLDPGCVGSCRLGECRADATAVQRRGRLDCHKIDLVGCDRGKGWECIASGEFACGCRCR